MATGSWGALLQACSGTSDAVWGEVSFGVGRSRRSAKSIDPERHLLVTGCYFWHRGGQDRLFGGLKLDQVRAASVPQHSDLCPLVSLISQSLQTTPQAGILLDGSQKSCISCMMGLSFLKDQRVPGASWGSVYPSGCLPPKWDFWGFVCFSASYFPLTFLETMLKKKNQYARNSLIFLHAPILASKGSMILIPVVLKKKQNQVL